MKYCILEFAAKVKEFVVRISKEAYTVTWKVIDMAVLFY